ncbi:SREBP regulating gene protein-like [Mercenaria mercenaria]|uniref:SREBP regulating gene protein-like n=1 Tax=Mercenaria mercenaria TaxID=6596 RepID=UPI00234E3EA5|nr:SREBP regulating gene protein-like [Mercenaria mercenaria]
MLRIRAFRRRWFLAVFAACFVLYIIYDNLDKTHTDSSSIYEVQHTLLRQTFQWQPKTQDVESNLTRTSRCRNSVQGRQYLVDERGYVCERSDLTSGGCCDKTTTKTTRYNCTTCKTNSCCTIYEYCVSCCLQPDKQPVLQRILQQARNSVDKLFVAVSDQFELCLAKCRTSSKSVQHENSYRDPRAKYCYGEDPPDLQMVVT